MSAAASPPDHLVTPAPFPHWMLREIFEQPETLTATLDEAVAGGKFREETCGSAQEWLRKAQDGIVIAASGSSRHAGMTAELLIEDHSGIAVDVEYASEYIYRSERSMKSAAVLVISQSGETADTLAALRKANSSGHPTLAITNVPGSSMAREATAAFSVAAGRERAIPATKSFTGQLLNLYLLSILAGELRGTVSPEERARMLQKAAELPAAIERQLKSWQVAAEAATEYFTGARSFLFLGRGVHYPIAREGALKLKESSYLHAEGYPSGELKHGPNALVGEDTPLVMVATVDRSDEGSVERYDKVVQLMADMRKQGARILAIANAEDTEVASLAHHVIAVEETTESLLPIAEVIPLQLLAYTMAIDNGIDVDAPRNLSKAVLAE